MNPSRLLLLTIELTECHIVHTTYKDPSTKVEIVKKCETRKGGISWEKSDLKEEKVKSKAEVAHEGARI